MTPEELQVIQLLHWLNNPWYVLLFTVLTIWALVWKGIALWKAAENKSKPWFAALLVVNTLGMLEIIYIFFLSKKRQQ